MLPEFYSRLNSQDDDKSYDMRYALRDIVENMRLRFKRSHCRHQTNQQKYKKNTEIRVEDITNFKVLRASKALLVAYKEGG